MEQVSQAKECSLQQRQCIPCQADVPPLKGMALTKLLGQLHNGWAVVDGHHLEKGFTFKDFRGALAFVNGVGALAEAQGHHPSIHLEWGHVRVTIWTHKIDGLTESDFIFAAKTDAIPRG